MTLLPAASTALARSDTNPAPARVVDGGGAEALTTTGSYPLLTVAEALGVRDRLSHPELLTHAGLRFDPELALEWSPHVVVARIYYQIFIDQALIPYLTEPPRP